MPSSSTTTVYKNMYMPQKIPFHLVHSEMFELEETQLLYSHIYGKSSTSQILHVNIRSIVC